MAAFNYIAFRRICPACSNEVSFVAQTHIASDFEGDASGRFANEVYSLGERMRWFSADHPDFETWKTWGGESSSVEEECPATCPNCKTRVVALIRFQDSTPVDIVSLREV